MFVNLSLLSFAMLASRSYAQDLCYGNCEDVNGEKTCTFTLKVDLYASELGYFTVNGCEGIMPTLGVERGVTYIFDQGDETNYYHPLGLAYYADGAHDDVDELEPVITPPGSSSNCAGNSLCPAPMYLKDGEYLGEYSNNEAIAPIASSDNFGLDDYEPEFFLDFLTWKTNGRYTIALKFDDDDFAQDFFYFCHIHQFMTGRIKLIDSEGAALYEDDFPTIPYEYEQPSDYDLSCGTSGLEEYTLPNEECPSKFVCGKPDGAVGAFAACLDSMNCAMTSGMTTNVHQGSAIALFNHQMIPHHQNAVNMCKALFKSGEVQCNDTTNEEDPHCVLTHLCYEIINAQNFQIQTMRGVLDSLDYAEEDDCKVNINSHSSKSSKSKKSSKKSKKSKRT